MAFKKKTYLGEFCAHEDEENESQELARRLHLLPPVCVDQRSHMQIESLCVPPHSSPFLPDLFFCAASSSVLNVLFCFFSSLNKKKKIQKKSLSNPVAESDRSVSRNRLCAYSFHIGEPYLQRLSLRSLRARTYLSLRRTVVNIGLKTRKRCRIHGYKPSL